ncbi:MAG TPA: potassium channel family protein [bacterium]|nr:potassium channel family protein [bacterium]HPQ65856.1 potassium channel family protein [bacterium]
MKKVRQRLIFFAGVFLAVMVLGTVGFRVLESSRFPSLFDSFYFTIVTVSTVGYGDMSPATSLGRALAGLVIILGAGTFLGVLASGTDLLLSRRETDSHRRKVYMLMGVFYAELGDELLGLFSRADGNIDGLRSLLGVKVDSGEEFFRALRDRSESYRPALDMEKINLSSLRDLLTGVRPNLVRLLENPILEEHRSFTDLLWSTFHLAQELSLRRNVFNLPAADRRHLGGDVARVYGRLIGGWVDYMQHLWKAYPYLYSLAVRTNPFDPGASPVITDEKPASNKEAKTA